MASGNGADLARHAGGRGAHGRRARRGRAPGRSGRRSRRAIPMPVHAGHGHSRRADRGRRRAGGRRRPATRSTSSACPPAIISANGRVGMKMVVDLPDGRRSASRAPFSTPSAIPNRRSSAFFYVHPDRRGFGRDLRAVLVPQSGAHRRIAICSTSCCIRICGAISHGGKLRSWGAKSLQESGQRGEPFLAGDGYARIGEGSGSTNVLTGSGVDEAWTTGRAARRRRRRAAARGQAVHPGESGGSLCRVGAAPVGWKQEGRIAEKRATVSIAALSPACSAWRLAGFTKGNVAIARRAATAMPPLDDIIAASFPAERSSGISERVPRARRRRAMTR